jgi:hypothetical protein
VVEAHFQTENLGWNTDDFLILGEDGSQTRRKLVGQVKRTFSVRATDDECKKAIQDYWKDFNNRQLFARDKDRFVLVTLRGTNTLLDHFSGLLDCARAATDEAEFTRRLAVPGFISAKSIQYRDEIQTIVSEIEGRIVNDVDLWPFLRLLHVVSLDLNTATGQTEAMINTLLAYTTKEQDAVGAASASWNSLLKLVGEGMPQARSFSRNDLPSDLLQRHSPVGGPEQRVLQTLKDHSTFILDGIRSTIGDDLHLGRVGLVNQIIQQLESTQIVLVSGAAGNGKSGVAKDVVSILGADEFAFSFRAEELARAHFDETLERSQIGANAAALGAILAGQGRKLLLVESVERLLEKSTRDAFTDLLTLAAKDRAWRIILTCRDYSLDLVRDCFLESARVSHSVVTVPPLDDTELAEVEAVNPALKRPLGNSTLRGLLRNPYILDKARQISWSEHQPLPQSEREFRALFWKDIVRVDASAAGGMPRRREEAFVKIALKRAQALTLYAASGELDPEAVDALRNDSLIVSSSQNRILVAPAHDVLEDWAIIQWIDEQHAALHGSAKELSATLGTYPAIRRTYRKWVSELMEREAPAADRLLQAVLQDGSLSSQFRDDTFVSLLRSPESPAFLERHRAEFFANDKELLRRVIHLLRVACVTSPLWLKNSKAHASLFNVPDGPAWPCVLQLIEANLGLFDKADCPLLLGLLEDWARGVSWYQPYPQGAKSVAAIAHWLLPHLDSYSSREEQKKTLGVIAKIPNGDRERFATLLAAKNDDDKRDRMGEDFREIIFEGFEGTPAARDMPDETIAACGDYLLCSEADLKRQRTYGGSLELETLFGIKENRSNDFFPASALRGPFLALLEYHFQKGLDFLISVFNQSADWYANPRVRSDRVEPPFEVKVDFSDAAPRPQWCNDRLWKLYRGTSVGPSVLQSILMALERWLLDLGQTQPQQLDSILLQILKRTDSAALSAVVASVATAYPQFSGESLLVLLQTPQFIILDRSRLVGESQAPSSISDLFPQIRADNKIYDAERKEADKRQHRREDLEAAVLKLQFGPLAPRVHKILDAYKAQMPPVDEQTEDDQLWRLSIHRMDLRQYSSKADTVKPEATSKDQTGSTDDRQVVRFDLKPPEQDIRKIVDESALEFATMNARLGLQMWGLKTYERSGDAAYDPGKWRERLQQARDYVVKHGRDDESDLARNGPGLVAAVCARDHYSEMKDEERDWCIRIICSEVEREGNNWEQFARLQRNHMSADRPCARVLPMLLGQTLTGKQIRRVRKAFVCALTHAIDEVRTYAAWGIGNYLWAIDRDLALRCVNALAMEATIVQQAVDEDKGRIYVERKQIDAIEEGAALRMRKLFFATDAIDGDSYKNMRPDGWFGADADGRILAILLQAPSESLAIEGFRRLASTLVAWWDADDETERGRGKNRQERNHDTETALTELIENFLLRTSAAAAESILQPILGVLDRHTRETRWIIQGLVAVEDRQPNTSQFWSLWRLFAERVRQAKWLPSIDEEHADGSEVMSAIFLTSGWKDHVRDWSSLQGYADNVHSLFNDLPVSSRVLDDYVRFLYHIGAQELPGAFVRIAKHYFHTGSAPALKSNTVYMLEILLRRHVYGRPLELKRNVELRDAILLLLDVLIEHGSSAAFRMRDDFVTPMGGEESS